MTAIIREANGFQWRAFVRLFAAALIGLVALLYAFTFALDPFGIRARPGHPPAPLMDINQRYMYPQLIRSGLFDGAIFGTSTVRLIDPQKLGPAFGAHVANFGMNAATPWEQVQLADLFLRHVPEPKLMVFGLDHTWCAADITNPEKRFTFRSFPPWLYGESRLAMLPQVFNLKSLEIAGRVLSNRLGIARVRGVACQPQGVHEAPHLLKHAARYAGAPDLAAEVRRQHLCHVRGYLRTAEHVPVTSVSGWSRPRRACRGGWGGTPLPHP